MKKILFHFCVISALFCINSVYAQIKSQGEYSDIKPYPGLTPYPMVILSGDVKLSLSKEPRLNEVVDAILECTPQCNIDTLVLTMKIMSGAQIISEKNVSKDSKQYSNKNFAKPRRGKTYKHTIKIKIISSPLRIIPDVLGRLNIVIEGTTVKQGLFDCNLLYYFLDEKTGRMRTIEEAQKDIAYHYDPAAGEFTGDANANYVEINQGIIKRMRSFEPALSDSEALALHGDMIQGIMYGVGHCKKDASKPASDVENMIIKYLLKEDWLGRLKNGTKDEWFKKLKENSIEKWRKSDNSGKDSKGIFIFSGQWKYKKHSYNKDLGLLSNAQQDALVRQSKVKIRVFWSGSSGNIWPTCYTDENGYFSVTGYDIPLTQNIYTNPILLLWNYDNTVKVSDPTPPGGTWDDPDDPSVWFLQRAGGGVDTVWGGSGGHSFGTVYPESLTTIITQPRSGAVNIYSTLLKCYKYLVPSFASTPPLDSVKALWEPGYAPGNGTCYLNNTIWVLGANTNTDEWDDQVLFHEYGHHTQYKCAMIPPATSSLYDWKTCYSGDPNLAYREGWPEFFSAIVSDSIYHVNTQNGINGGSSWYWNREDPWDYTGNSGSPFQPSPWTIGSVAGSLWDIADFIDEVPYANDSLRADTLSMGFDECWNIFDNYQTGGHYCYTMWDFLDGWDNYNYGHKIAIDDIVIYHKIFSAGGTVVTSAPVITQKESAWDLIIQWASNLLPWKASVKSLMGYNVYRLDPGDTSFVKINEAVITDTFYIDLNVKEGLTYGYCFTGLDSNGIEGPLSYPTFFTVQHVTSLTTTSLATAYNNASKLVCDTTGQNLHLVYQSNDKVWYSHSTDGGASWSADTAIGEGQYPAIALDKNEMPNVVWSKKINTKDCNIYFSKYNSPAGWSAPYVLGTFLMPQVSDLVSQMVPGFAVSKDDTGFITWLASPAGVHLPTYDITYGGWFSTGNPGLQYTPLDSVNVLAYRCPTVAADTFGATYFAWDAKPALYYAIGYRKRDDSGNILPTTYISEGGENESPCLNFSRWQNSVDGIWEGPFNPLISYRSIQDTAQNWGALSCIDSSALQPTIIAGGYAAYSKDGEIYLKRKVGNIWPDTTLKNISNTVAESNYPHLAFSQTAESTNLYCAWTEGDSVPYQIKFVKIAVHPVAKVYADLGGAELSPYCIQRAGYKTFGSEPYQTVDYHPQRLIYKFGGFNKNKKYSLEMVYYYQDQNEAAEKGAKGGNRKYWMQELNIDGTCKANTKLMSGQRVVVKKSIPPAAYNKDGEILVYIDKVSGDYAVCAEIFLYEFDKDCEDCTDGKSIQASSSVLNGLPLTTAVYQNAPNPFNQATTIRYQMSKPGNVSLKVYNIAGQLVKTLINYNQMAGYYSVNWDGKDEKGCKISNGIYLYQLQTTNCSKTYKMVVLR